MAKRDIEIIHAMLDLNEEILVAAQNHDWVAMEILLAVKREMRDEIDPELAE